MQIFLDFYIFVEYNMLILIMGVVYMKNKSNRCSICKYFDRYYIKGATRFSETDCGQCMKNHAYTSAKECCESYAHKTPRRRHVLLIRHALNDLLTELSALRLSLESEYIELE